VATATGREALRRLRFLCAFARPRYHMPSIHASILDTHAGSLCCALSWSSLWSSAPLLVCGRFSTDETQRYWSLDFGHLDVVMPLKPYSHRTYKRISLSLTDLRCTNFFRVDRRDQRARQRPFDADHGWLVSRGRAGPDKIHCRAMWWVNDVRCLSDRRAIFACLLDWCIHWSGMQHMAQVVMSAAAPFDNLGHVHLARAPPACAIVQVVSRASR
jgi:hypothetical protein